ncbi:LEA_2 domain-containing protein [Cephalotus follicularis]|uniref:LEA_2 domain-containing protein n=1 Tax=Cephalotus follicularis TaxID=3775 RepID=A0A1Q3BHD3_CEPFO|nr:LEA_2 domain-containing protein [Cephalotus follicularis]
MASQTEPKTPQMPAPPQPQPQPQPNHNVTNNHRPRPQQPEPTNHNHNHNHHPYYPATSSPYYSSSSSASFKGCCCCLFLLFSFIALLILAVVLVILLAVKPKKPQFDLQQVGVQYMGITASNSLDPTSTSSPPPTTSASLSLTIRMLFTAVNPNKVGIKYGESSFTVMYRGIPLGKASVPGFYQEAHSERQVEAIIAVDRVNLMQADAADLIRDASLNDRVELRVLGDVAAKIRVLDFDSPGVQVSVDCAIVISPRKQSLIYKQCGFDGLSV